MEGTQNAGNLSKHVATSVNMVQSEFGIGCLSAGIAAHMKLVLIPRGILHVRRDIISKFVLRTLATKTNMPLEMIFVMIRRAMCKLYSYNRFAMPEVTICTENNVTPTLSARIASNGDTLQYLRQNLI